VEDAHSGVAQERMRENRRVYLTPLHLAECSHAIAKQVFYRKISLPDADIIFDTFNRDRADGLWLERAMPENAFEICAELGRRHAPKLGMRTADTLHVACALEFKAERFWTFDERQAKLAKAQGMKTS
jgi:predicted nucleic acid-binding protein